jgi:NADPH:quinone reductase-like Zn-dependent oxidoreductase
MKFEEAAAIPQAAVLALQSLCDKRQVRKGDKVLINGAGGGVGTFAVQMSKSFGAEVTCVDSTEKLDMLRSLGADYVIDYKQKDFTKNGQCYDLIVDVVAHRSIFKYKRSLLPNGILVLVGGTISAILQTAFLGSLISMTGNRKMGVLIHKPNKNLAFIKELFEAGKAIPVNEKTYPLSEVPKAIQDLGEGHVKGKIVISV